MEAAEARACCIYNCELLHAMILFKLLSFSLPLKSLFPQVYGIRKI